MRYSILLEVQNKSVVAEGLIRIAIQITILWNCEEPSLYPKNETLSKAIDQVYIIDIVMSILW